MVFLTKKNHFQCVVILFNESPVDLVNSVCSGEFGNSFQEIEQDDKHEDVIAPLIFSQTPISPWKEQTPSKRPFFDKPQHWKSSEKKALKPLKPKLSTEKKTFVHLTSQQQQQTSSLKPGTAQNIRKLSFQPSWLKTNDELDGLVPTHIQQNLEDTFEDFADNVRESVTSDVPSAALLGSTKKSSRTHTAKAGSLKWRFMKVVRDNSSAKLWSNAFSKGEQGFGLENPKNRFTKLFEVQILQLLNVQSMYVHAKVQVMRVVTDSLQKDSGMINFDTPVEEARKIDHTDFQAIALFKRQTFNHDWISPHSSSTIKIYNPIQLPISSDSHNPYIQFGSIQGWQSSGHVQEIILCSDIVEVMDT
jgi:hypothetical protein